MSNDNVIDFVSHLKKKQSKERLTEEILASGWEITDDINAQNRDIQGTIEMMSVVKTSRSGVEVLEEIQLNS